MRQVLQCAATSFGTSGHGRSPGPHLRNCLRFRAGLGRLATWRGCSAAATFAAQAGGEAAECDAQRGVKSGGFLGPKCPFGNGAVLGGFGSGVM